MDGPNEPATERLINRKCFFFSFCTLTLLIYLMYRSKSRRRLIVHTVDAEKLNYFPTGKFDSSLFINVYKLLQRVSFLYFIFCTLKTVRPGWNNDVNVKPE